MQRTLHAVLRHSPVCTTDEAMMGPFKASIHLALAVVRCKYRSTLSQLSCELARKEQSQLDSPPDFLDPVWQELCSSAVPSSVSARAPLFSHPPSSLPIFRKPHQVFHPLPHQNLKTPPFNISTTTTPRTLVPVPLKSHLLRDFSALQISIPPFRAHKLLQHAGQQRGRARGHRPSASPT